MIGAALRLSWGEGGEVDSTARIVHGTVGVLGHGPGRMEGIGGIFAGLQTLAIAAAVAVVVQGVAVQGVVAGAGRAVGCPRMQSPSLLPDPQDSSSAATASIRNFKKPNNNSNSKGPCRLILP